MGIEKQGAKPTGIIGNIFGRLMNKVHTALYMKYFNNNLPPNGSTIIDIGCGGGKFIQFMANRNKSYKLFGIDHSPEMVTLSTKTNKHNINKNKVSILNASVNKIPLDNYKIDLACAFETIQFWADMDNSLTEINRVLKNAGTFIIINRYPNKGGKWWNLAIIKSEKQYVSRLKKAGFSKVKTDLDFKKEWIIVTATK